MRGGITCIKCNSTKKSLKFFNLIEDKYQCSYCGAMGIVREARNKQ